MTASVWGKPRLRLGVASIIQIQKKVLFCPTAGLPPFAAVGCMITKVTKDWEVFGTMRADQTIPISLMAFVFCI